MSIIAYPLEATEYTAEDVQSYLSTRTSGVYSNEITFTPEGMTVTVSPFLAWFNYARFKGCSVAVTEPETLTFSPAHAVLDRIDRIVLRLDLSINKAYLAVIEGVASSSPVPPDIEKTKAVNDISPVYVKIKAGSAEITPADITSTILDESVCGIMRDGVTGIPTAQLQSQAEALILRLHEAINDVEADAACMLRDLYDPQDKAKPVAFEDEVVSNKGGEMTGTITNVNSTSFAALHKQRVVDRETFYASFGTGAMDGSATGAIELAKIIEGQRKMIARLDVCESKIVFRLENNEIKEVFGEHNKPTGSYTGNGSSVQRSINTGEGIGDILFIHSDYGNVLVFNDGAIVHSLDDIWATSDASYLDGVLNIGTSDEVLNAKGQKYSYRLL